MKVTSKWPMLKQPLVVGILVFIFLMVLTQGISRQRYLILKSADERELTNHADWTKERIQNVFSYSLATTRTLAFMVQEYGEPKDFDATAKELIKLNPYAGEVELVEGGVIKYIYPLAGNEPAIGVDILKDTLRLSGARTAIITKQFYVAGPLHLIQGGEGFVARHPIYRDNKFWGFSAVIIRLPALLKAIQIDTTDHRLYSYQLSKVNSETGREEFFLKQEAEFGNKPFIPIQFSDGEWRLYVIPEKSNTLLSVAIFSVLGLLLSLTGGFLAWLIVAQPVKLKTLIFQKTEQIRHSEAKLRTMLERLSLGFVSLDKDFRFTYANKKIGEITGRNPAELIGRKVWDEFPAAVGSPTYNAFHEAMEKQKNVTHIDHYEPLDFWQENDIYPTEDGLSIFVKDITEAVRSKEQIILERNLSESVINSLPGVFYLYDEHGRFLRWNKNFEHVTGYTSTEIQQMHPLDFFTGDEKKLVEERIGRVFDQGMAEVEAYFTNKKGENTPYYFNGWAIQYEGKRCLIGVGIDITSRKQAEAALVGSEEKYRYLFHNNPALIIIWDPETYRILEINDKMVEEYGYSRAEFLNMTIFDYRPPEDMEDVKQFIREMAAGEGSKLRKTGRHFKKNGQLMYMDVVSHRIDYGGKKAMLSLAKDITEQVTAEKQLKKTYDDLRRLNAHLQTVREEERSTIAREIHDELGQLLTGIKMDVSWFSKKIDSTDSTLTSKMSELLGLIDETITSIRRIASDLRPGILDDLGLIAALEWQCSEFEKRTGIKCNFETAIEDLNVDRNMATCFFRIFQESLTNIMRYAEASEVRSTLEMTDGSLTLTITDNGVGFNESDIQDKKTLGLLGMKERAHMLGGTVQISSQKNQGTTVKLSVVIPSATVDK